MLHGPDRIDIRGVSDIMVKPAKAKSGVSQQPTRGTVKAHRLLRRSRKQARLKLQRWHLALNQPVSEAAKAEDARVGESDKERTPSPTKGMDGFLETGRTGRRNALPDICNEKVAGLSTAHLPMDMCKLSCSEEDGSSSKSSEQVNKPPS